MAKPMVQKTPTEQIQIIHVRTQLHQRLQVLLMRLGQH